MEIKVLGSEVKIDTSGRIFLPLAVKKNINVDSKFILGINGEWIVAREAKEDDDEEKFRNIGSKGRLYVPKRFLNKIGEEIDTLYLYVHDDGFMLGLRDCLTYDEILEMGKAK